MINNEEQILVGTIITDDINGIINESDLEVYGAVVPSVEIVGEVNPSAEINVSIVGTGPRGEQGKSAYELWLEQGNTGTVDDFINTIQDHPLSHPPSMIDETEEKQFISAQEKARIKGYVHDQIEASSRWHIRHTLDKFPSVSVVDTGGNLVTGEVVYLSKDDVLVIFSAEFSGKAYLN